MNGEQIRRIMLEVISELSQKDGSFQAGSVLDEAASRLGVRYDIVVEQAILTFWYDLFRLGHLSWGYNLANPNPPFCHLTEQGRRTLAHYSRDPVNIDGYLAYLNAQVHLSQTSKSYIDEALIAYNSNCFKATAVMIGAAAENIVIELRDTLISRLSPLGQKVSAGLTDWKIKTILDALEKELEKKKKDMPKNLADAFSSYWPAFSHQIRTARNDAGHPANVLYQ